MNSKAQNLRAKRTLSHASRYLRARGESAFGVGPEANALKFVRIALLDIYKDHRARFSRAIIPHRCTKCCMYLAAGMERL